MKKSLAILLSLAIMFSPAGCSNKNSTSEEKSSKKKSSLPEKSNAFHLKSGDVMIAKILSEDEAKYNLDWKGKKIVLYKELIDHLGTPEDALKQKKEPLSDKEISDYWPYEHDVVIRLKNQNIMDAKIAQASRKQILLKHPIEDTDKYMKQVIERSQIEYLMFKPVKNEASEKYVWLLKINSRK